MDRQKKNEGKRSEKWLETMNSKDQLEDYIRSNREAFDDKTPPSSVWDKINSSMHTTHATSWWNNVTIWRAAAILFMAMSVYLIIPAKPSDDNAKLALKEFGDVEAFYIREISQKEELIEAIAEGSQPEEFTQDLHQLEAMYLVLKEEMKTRPSKKVKDALVLNFLVRINLLNQQLHKLEEEYEEENAGGEASI
jgi:hypothetical protein